MSQKSKGFTRAKSTTRSRSVCTIECCWFHDVHRIHVVCKVLGRCIIQDAFEGKLNKYVARTSQHPGTPALESHVPHTYRDWIFLFHSRAIYESPNLKCACEPKKTGDLHTFLPGRNICLSGFVVQTDCSYQVLSLKFNTNKTQMAILSELSFPKHQFWSPNVSEFWGCKTPPFRRNMPEGTDLGSDPFSACLYPQRFWSVCQTLGLDGFIWHIYLSSWTTSFK